MRIGLISDTHIPVAAPRLWPEVFEALRGVDLVMHGGDLMVPDVIDWLEEIAPVTAMQGNGDYTGWRGGRWEEVRFDNVTHWDENVASFCMGEVPSSGELLPSPYC